jgi:hypothetical protein
MSTSNSQLPTSEGNRSAGWGESCAVSADSRRLLPRSFDRLSLGVGSWKLGVVLALALAAAPSAQEGAPKVKPSQHGTVSQRIADTTITVDYNRPVARGRELFGKLVPYGRVWCPGADDCTTIEVSTKVTFEGQELPAGKYSVWTEPGPEKWVVIFNKQANAFHTRYPAGQDALRLEVTPRTGSRMETLAFYFPAVDGHKGELALHWGTVVVPLKFEVP